MGSLRFNIHRVAEKIGRPALLSVMTVNAIKKLHLHEAFDKYLTRLITLGCLVSSVKYTKAIEEM